MIQFNLQRFIKLADADGRQEVPHQVVLPESGNLYAGVRVLHLDHLYGKPAGR